MFFWPIFIFMKGIEDTSDKYVIQPCRKCSSALYGMSPSIDGFNMSNNCVDTRNLILICPNKVVIWLVTGLIDLTHGGLLKMCKCNLHLVFSQCNIIHIHVHTGCTFLHLRTAFSALNLFVSTQTISAKMSFICCRLLPMWRIVPMTSTLCPKNQMLRILMVFNSLILLKRTQSGLKKNTLLPEQQTL